MEPEQNEKSTPEERTESFVSRVRRLVKPAEDGSPQARNIWYTAGKYLLRAFALLLVTALLCVAFVWGVLAVLTRGPSEAARDILVSSLTETSALKFLPYWFLSEQEVETILHPAPDPFRELRQENVSAAAAPVAQESAKDGETLELVDISGSTWKGKMLVIHDPARVVVGTLPAYGYGGKFLEEFVEDYGAVAGTNAGGFEDAEGQGNGGTPDGLVIRDGKIAYGWENAFYANVIGFDAENRLHVGNMMGREALALGLRSAVSFTPGPVLIQDGVPQSGWGESLNPRTCIGQAEDGTVYLAVIEGRKPDSLGASFDDLVDLMEECGAVNAANLDGGSSSTMYYEGEQIIRASNIVGARRLATSILVLAEEGEE